MSLLANVKLNITVAKAKVKVAYYKVIYAINSIIDKLLGV